MTLPRLKQVILIRRDLRMRRGKEIAQGSHASLEFLVHDYRKVSDADGDLHVTLTENERRWLTQGMGKVCLQVGSEAELIELYEKARTQGLKSFLVRDSGRTEFHGEPTLTTCAIGPDEAEKIDAVTGHLTPY